MNIDLLELTVRDLWNGYEDNDEGGVVGYSGRLDVRPPYQREFIYKDKQRDAVVQTVMRDFPLNVMYWAVRDDGGFEVIDGQQRTISICQYVEGDFAFNGRYFHNLQSDEQEQILDYQLMVYLCSGTDSERLDWFRTINIAGEKLTDQELRNAVYAGSWVSDAKRYFSRSGCPAAGLAGDLVAGSPIRQEFLETAIDWLSAGDVEGYMAVHQHDPNANELWLYFKGVIDWVTATFPNHRAEMKGRPWGELYSAFKAVLLDPAELEVRVTDLMSDEEVTEKRGIYAYVLDGKEKHLALRRFSPGQRREAYERQKGVCAACSEHFEMEEMEADHIEPWHRGGKTEPANCQMLCREDNRAKGGT